MMATVSRAEAKDMYSWWWDSHISPKNSKWLQENLTEMDSNIRTMIKLIEVDEDSFAKRAEMYYKKRPELMKLVEEFYRAYRALAERYYHARGVIRQAHRKMAEVFPNEVPLVITDDGPVNPSHDCDPRTPEMQPPVRVSFDSDELQEATGLSSTDFLSGQANGEFTNESSLLAGRKGSKHLNGFGKARKGLNFHEVHDGEECMKKNEQDNAQTQVLSESERLGRSETDILALKEALSKLEAEKEAGLLQYQQTLGRLSKLEAEVSQAKQDSEGLAQRATKAEAEVQSLKETLAKVEAEKDASLFQYRQCLDRISNMEAHISRAQQNVGQFHERAFKAEKETELLKEELARLKTEKDALLSKYLEALEKIANLENKLLLAEDYASRSSDRADRAEKEVETLKETVTSLTEEKEAAVLKCEQCLEKIVALEHEIALIQEETDRLKVEVQDGVAKLKGAEEQCLLLEGTNKSLQSEISSLVEKIGIQNQELSERQKEMGRLWACVQEERMRFMETENAFQSLQNLHSKVQEELRSVVAELQKKVRLLNEMEIQNQHLVDEVQNVKTENKGLHDLNLSSAVSMKNMQEEILQLKDGKGKLEGELELQHDHRNALQQEVYSLEEELNFLSQKHQDVLVQMESVGLNPESFVSSVKELKHENLELKDSSQRSNAEVAALVEKLVVMEKLIHKIELLEKSLSDLSAEFGRAREKVKELEESSVLLNGEKSALADEKTALLSQLQITAENLEKVSESNTFLEISLSDANAELEMLRAKSKKLEDSCRLLNDQNTVLVRDKQTLASQTESTQQSLEDLGKKHVDLEKSYLALEGERETMRKRVEELQVCLDIEKQEHANSRHLSQMQMAELEDHIRAVQEVGDHMREQFEEELDRAMNAQFEIFILRKSIQDLKVQNTSLLGYREKLVEASLLSEKLVSELERMSNEQEEEVLVMSSQIKGVRTGMFEALKALETDTSLSTNGYEDEDQRIIHHVLGRLRNVKGSLSQVLDENQELVIQKSVLVAVLGQLKRVVGDLNAVIITLGEEISDKNEQLLVLEKEMQKLLENNEELILKVKEGNPREVVLLSNVEILCGKLFTLQGAYKDLQEEKSGFIKDKESLMKAFEDLEEEKHNLEYECSCMVEEAVALDNLSVVFKNVLSEKSRLITEVRENIDKVCSDNALLVERMRTVEAKLEEVQAKNINLEVLLKKSENEVEEARVLNKQLKDEITNTEDLLFLKEMKLLETEAIKVHQENKILELSDNYAQQLEECKGLYNIIHHLDSQVLEMQKQNEKAEARVGVLSSELQKGKDETKLWETVAGAFFTELQSCSVREALIREKFSELRKAYETLEEENCSKGMDIVQLRERVGVLEDENCEMKARLAADRSAISSLKESVASLEKHTIWPAKRLRNDNEEKEGAEGCQKLCEDTVTAAELDGLFDLQDLQARIQAVEKSVIELKQRAHEGYSTLCSDLDSATRQIEVLKSQNCLRRSSGRFSRRFPSHQHDDSKNGSTSGDKPVKMSPAASEPGDELRMKDIMLDQVSDCSSSGKFRRIIGSDDQVLELWQTMDQEASIDLTVGKYRSAAVVPNKHSHLESVKENKSGRPSSESMIEKELGVDEQDSSKRFLNAHQEDTKRKTLERLASDVQRLTNLQITVQDLKERLEMTENSSKGKGFQCDGVKDQLGETEETILKLFDYSAKLMKKIEKSSPSSFDAPSTADSSDGGGARRRKCSEQARRISEKIGRLQLEVQKIQFHLMKLDNNKAPKAGTRITERNTRILLKDYLYGVSRTPRRRKRTHFCGCVQPPTKGD